MNQLSLCIDSHTHNIVYTYMDKAYQSSELRTLDVELRVQAKGMAENFDWRKLSFIVERKLLGCNLCSVLRTYITINPGRR